MSECYETKRNIKKLDEKEKERKTLCIESLYSNESERKKNQCIMYIRRCLYNNGWQIDIKRQNAVSREKFSYKCKTLSIDSLHFGN